MDDASPGRDDLEVAKSALTPPEERVPFAVPLEFQLRIPEHGGRGAEFVDLDRMVYDELGGNLRIDARRVAAERVHRLAHRRQIDDRRDASEVL